MWSVYVYGTNNIIKPDADSMVDISLVDGTADPATDSRWVRLEVFAIDPHWDSFGDVETGNGGVAIHPRALVRTFSLQLDPFVFPDDMHKIETIANVINKRRVFLHKGDYASTADWQLHADGKAMCVALKISTEDIHDDGTKSITLEGRNFRVRR